jgi:hypothetical protein
VLVLAAQNQPAPPFFFVQMSDPQFGMFTSRQGFRAGDAEFRAGDCDGQPLASGFRGRHGRPGEQGRRRRTESRSIAASPRASIDRFRLQHPRNHDVENAPTSASVAAYVKTFGPDHYSFRAQSLYGIVLDSTVIAAPDGVRAEYGTQDRWLSDELARAQASGARHVVVFQHHPWFLNAADEADGYFNIPLARRTACWRGSRPRACAT